MKKYLIKYKDTGILVFILVVSTFLFWFNIISDKEFLGLIVSVATIYFGMLKYRIENDRVFKDLFDTFNKRYTDNFNDKLMKIKNNTQNKLDQEDENLVIDYFNLCAEEFLWYERGRIPKKVWKSWRSGILVNLKDEKIQSIYDAEMETKEAKESYYGLDKELKKYLLQSNY